MAMRALLLFPLYSLFPYHLGARTSAFPVEVVAHASNVTQTNSLDLPDPRRLHQRNQALAVYGLPYPWQGVFRSIQYILPPLPQSCFVHFFLSVLEKARRDSVPGRPYQRFQYGSFILEFMAESSRDGPQTVTREFVAAAALWLSDAARHGWTDFFEAKVLDPVDKEVVYIHMANIWDAWAKPGYLDEWMMTFGTT